MRKIVLLAFALTLASCVDPGAQRRAFLASLIGQPEAVAVQTLGVPTRTYQAGGTKFLAYDQRRVDVLPGGPFYGGYGYGWGGYYGGFPPAVIERGCEMTLEVVGGTVRSWSLRGTVCG